MSRNRMLSLGLSGLLVLPASAALACHLETVSLELSCTQYKLNVSAVNLQHSHSINYNFVVTPTNGGSPISISQSVALKTPSGSFSESVSNSLKLVGNFDAKSFSGSASLISETGAIEHTKEMTLSPVALSCATQTPGS